jgi:hypothetical protein
MQMNDEIFESICTELQESWEGLSIICPKHKVARSSFYAFKDETQERLDRYARAREMQIDFLEDLLMKIAMEKSQDTKTEGVVNIGSNIIGRAKLQVDTIKFVLAKLRSNVWGDRLKLDADVKIESITGMEIK